MISSLHDNCAVGCGGRQAVAAKSAFVLAGGLTIVLAARPARLEAVRRRLPASAESGLSVRLSPGVPVPSRAEWKVGGLESLLTSVQEAYRRLGGV